MPALGMARERGILVRWLRGEGESVGKGEPLVVVETDKTAVKVEAPATGILAHITAAVGDEVPVGRAIAVILAPGESVPGGPPRVKEIIPLSAMRRIVGQRMTQSKQTAPHFYVSVDVDVTEVDRKRREWKEGGRETIPSMNDFILWASAQAIKDFPLLNSTLTAQGIQVYSDINIGMAVAIEAGLVVPVVRNADRLSLEELARRCRGLVEKAERRRLLPLDYEGGTFTVSNLGMLGVDRFVAIINPPQCAILAVGRAAPRVVACGDGMAVRSIMTMTLSADHRIIDGVLASRFLQRVKRILEGQ